MPKVTYGGQSYECGDKTVLECLTAQGVEIPHSCRSGLCQTCMMQSSGPVPAEAQAGLKPTLAAQNYFLSCLCRPHADIEVALPDSSNVARIEARVSGMEYLADDVLGIRLKPAGAFDYRAGQFINFFKDESTSRCYSLASVPDMDDELLLNVRRVPGGQVSGWIFEQLKTGDVVDISEAIGDCFYLPGMEQQSILMIGTGCGLAPLYGIIRDALHQGHAGPIKLYHGSCTTSGFYLVDELRRLEREHANFSYVPCVSECVPDEALMGCAQGMVLDIAMQQNPDLTGWRVFLCGNPDMVKAAKREVYLSGASIKDIHVDQF